MALPRERVTQEQLKELRQRPDFKSDDAITAAGICFREIKRDLNEIDLNSRRVRIMRREFNDAALFAFKLIIFGLKFPPHGRDLLLEVSISAMTEYYEHLSAHDMHWHRNMGTIFRRMTWLFPDQNEEADIRDLDDSTTTSPAETTNYEDTLPTLLIQVPELAKKVERVLGTSVYNEDAHSLYTVLRAKCDEGPCQGGSASSKPPKTSSDIAESQEHSWSHYGTTSLDLSPRDTLETPRSNDASISRFLASLMAASTENEKRLNGSTENLVVESSLATEFEDTLRILEDGVERRTACETSGRNHGITNLREPLGESKAKRRRSPTPDSQRKLLKAITPPPDSQHGAFLNRIITPEPTAVSGFPAEDLTSTSILPSYFSGVQTADDDPWYFDNQTQHLGSEPPSNSVLDDE
ncbi:hypothetical protein QFC24_007043 [Naganishia onofrii]|uniref:Uncharacterized protein n=1 Tax=Naganishia onofrii TaxID=1851511 RepID=A0ACC2WVJ1_9TREE|nr:hypothetical protein QFC24_007043 [Naganishia onofrii]